MPRARLSDKMFGYGMTQTTYYLRLNEMFSVFRELPIIIAVPVQVTGTTNS